MGIEWRGPWLGWLDGRWWSLHRMEFVKVALRTLLGHKQDVFDIIIRLHNYLLNAMASIFADKPWFQVDERCDCVVGEMTHSERSFLSKCLWTDFVASANRHCGDSVMVFNHLSDWKFPFVSIPGYHSPGLPSRPILKLSQVIKSHGYHLT